MPRSGVSQLPAMAMMAQNERARTTQQCPFSPRIDEASMFHPIGMAGGLKSVPRTRRLQGMLYNNRERS